MSETQSELHNRLAGPIINSIVKPPLKSGGDISDVLVLLESVVTGVLMAVVKPGRDGPVLDHFTEGVRGRIAEIRLKDTPPAGQA